MEEKKNIISINMYDAPKKEDFKYQNLSCSDENKEQSK